MSSRGQIRPRSESAEDVGPARQRIALLPLLRKNKKDLRKRVVQDELLEDAGRIGNLAKSGENYAKLTRACDYIAKGLDDIILHFKRTQQEATLATAVLYGPEGPASVGINENFPSVGVKVASCETIYKNNGVTDCVQFTKINTSAGLLVLAAALLPIPFLPVVYAFPGTDLAARGATMKIALDRSKPYFLHKYEIFPAEIPAVLQAVLARTAYTSQLSKEVLWTTAQARDYFPFKSIKDWRIPDGDAIKKEHFTSNAIRAVLLMSPPLQEHSVVDLILAPAALAFLKATFPLLANLEGPNVQAKTACINGTNPGLYVNLKKMAGKIKEEGTKTKSYFVPYDAADFDMLFVLSVKAEEDVDSVECTDVQGIFIIPMAALKAHRLVDFKTPSEQRIVGKKSMYVWPPQTDASRDLYGQGKAKQGPFEIDRHGTVVDWDTGELTKTAAYNAKEHWTTQYYISMEDLRQKKIEAGVAF